MPPPPQLSSWLRACYKNHQKVMVTRYILLLKLSLLHKIEISYITNLFNNLFSTNDLEQTPKILYQTVKCIDYMT